MSLSQESSDGILHDGERQRHDVVSACSHLLREQIAMLSGPLAPGGEWDRTLANAERRVAQIRAERAQTEHTLSQLQDALAKCLHSGEPKQHSKSTTLVDEHKWSDSWS